MSVDYEPAKYRVVIDDEICTRCGRCSRECGWSVIAFDEKPIPEHARCRACQRCAAMCPVGAIRIRREFDALAADPTWNNGAAAHVRLQANTGGILLSSMGSSVPLENPFDHLVLDACQVTNPSIDPLREPMELETFIGSRPDAATVACDEQTGKYRLATPDNELPSIKLDTPIMFAPMSYGSVSLNVHDSLATAAQQCGTIMGTGEGGLHESLYDRANSIVVQVASGRFSVNKEVLMRCAGIEIKVGQGAKPGIGGHLPGSKIDDSIAKTRMIPKNTDAISPAPHHDIYSIEDLRQLISALKETSEGKPVGVKIAAVHNVAAIASGIVHAGADWITIDGFTASTGAAPVAIRDNVGIPLAYAIAAVDDRLRKEKIRSRASLIASGSIRNAADVAKAIALGADAVAIGTAALVAVGCRVCHSCHTGCCSWGIATQKPELTKRLKPKWGAQQAENLLHAWTHELTEILGSLGINAIESLRSNRDRLRTVGLDESRSDILGVKMAGR